MYLGERRLLKPMDPRAHRDELERSCLEGKMLAGSTHVRDPIGVTCDLQHRFIDVEAHDHRCDGDERPCRQPGSAREVERSAHGRLSLTEELDNVVVQRRGVSARTAPQPWSR